MMQLLGQHLREIGTTKLFRAGSGIFFQGEVPKYGMLVTDGTVRAYTINTDGAEAIMHLFGKGSIIPAAWVSNQMPTAMFNYDAMDDVRAVVFTKEALFEALENNPDYQKEYLENLSRSQAALYLRITGLIQNRAIDKICYTLYYLMFRYGIEKKPGIFQIRLRITQGTLAQLIGQTRENTAKNLKLLTSMNIVSFRSSTYYVNQTKLEAFMGEESFKELSL